MLSLLVTTPMDKPVKEADQTGELVWIIREESPIYLEIARFVKKLT